MQTPAKSLLKSAAKVAVLTGAGVSAESGIPTFREQRRLLAEAIASKIWRHRKASRAIRNSSGPGTKSAAARLRKAQPNAGHEALAAMEKRVAEISR